MFESANIQNKNNPAKIFFQPLVISLSAMRGKEERWTFRSDKIKRHWVCSAVSYPGRDLNPHALASSRFWVYRVYHSTTRAFLRWEVWGMRSEILTSDFRPPNCWNLRFKVRSDKPRSLLKSGAKIHTFFDVTKIFFVEPIIFCIFALVFNQ